MNISAPFIQRPIATALLMVGLAGRRPGRLSAVAGRGAAERQLSDASGHGAAAGRRSADHGVVGGDAARTAVRRDPGPHPDDVGERARLHPDHAAVRFEPPDRWGGQRYAVGDQCRERVPAGRHAVSADDPQGQSGRHADPGARPHLGQPAADHCRRLRAKYSAAKDIADIRRRPRRHRRSAAARRPRAARSAGAGRARHQPRGCPHGARPGERRSAQRARSTARARPSRSIPTISCSSPTSTPTWSLPIATDRRSASATSAAPSARRRTT